MAAPQLEHGSVVIAAITSCTNTSNPSVMIGAGLVAKKAAERGPDQQAVGEDIARARLARWSPSTCATAGLQPYLDRLGFNLVGYGCTTCIGNSGPLPDEIAGEIRERGLVVAAVLSGNRNFEGRIQQDVRANYLASPPLVVAYALAGSMNVDLTTRAARHRAATAGRCILKDIWPTEREIQEAMLGSVTAQAFTSQYASVFEGDERWRALPVPTGDRFAWEADSTYIRRPPFLEGLSMTPAPPADIRGARVLALLGDSITTDHISPAGIDQGRQPGGEVPRSPTASARRTSTPTARGAATTR